MVLRMPSLLIWARVQLFLMNNIPLIIMAAGVSSRMKTSNVSTDLSEDQVYQSNSRAKGFIEINEKSLPHGHRRPHGQSLYQNSTTCNRKLLFFRHNLGA